MKRHPIQHLGWRRACAQAPNGVGHVVKKGAGVVPPAFAQAAPEGVAVLRAGGAAGHQLVVLRQVARKQRQPLPLAARRLLGLLDQVGPIAGGAQVVDDDHAGVAQHVVHVKIGGGGLAQPHEVGQPHAGEIGGQ